MSSDVWVDKQGNRWHVTLHDPVCLANTAERRLAVRWALTLTDAQRRCKGLYVELDNSLSELLGLSKAQRQSEFRECLLGAAKQALFMGRLSDSETVEVDGSPDNVLRLYYTPSDCYVSELATAKFGFEMDECYEADLESYVRTAIYTALSPRRLSGVAYPDILEAVGTEEDVFERVLDDMIENELVSREQPNGNAPEVFRITSAGRLDASATARQRGSAMKPSLDVLIGKLRRDDEHLDVEAKESFFVNTKHKDTRPGSPQPNDECALKDMLKTLVAFANTYGGDFVVGLKNITWQKVGIDDTDLVLCKGWDEFKRRLTRLMSDETKGIAPAPEIHRQMDGGGTFAIVRVRQLPESCFRNRTLAYMKHNNRHYIRTNGDSVQLELSDIATHCDAMLELSRLGP